MNGVIRLGIKGADEAAERQLARAGHGVGPPAERVAPGAAATAAEEAGGLRRRRGSRSARGGHGRLLRRDRHRSEPDNHQREDGEKAQESLGSSHRCVLRDRLVDRATSGANRRARALGGKERLIDTSVVRNTTK